MWRLFLAKFIFRHSTIESLLRECRRNSQLRQLCGLQLNYIPRDDSNPHLRLAPSSAAMSRFIKSLQKNQEIFTEMRMVLNAKLQAALPDLGLEVAIDGKSFKVMPIKYLLKNQMAEEKRKQTRQLKFIVQITELKLRSIILVSKFI